MNYFTVFADNGLESWEADRGNTSKLLQVENAFVQTWGAFKNGSRTLDELEAVLPIADGKNGWN